MLHNKFSAGGNLSILHNCSHFKKVPEINGFKKLINL